jgi:hypothetical protein
MKKAILFPAKYKIFFSGSPDREGFNKLFTTYPIKIGQYSPQTYEYWIAFILEYLKDKGYDIILYDLEQNERVSKFVNLLEEKEIIKTSQATIKNATDLKNIIVKNNYYSNDSTFIGDDLKLMQQCEKIYPENRFPEFPELLKETEKGKLLKYAIWHESKFTVVDRNTVTTKTSFYKYNARNDLSVLLPDLILFH